MTIPTITVQTGYTPSASDWNDWLNRAINKLNAGIAPSDLVLDSSGRFAINIDGDATTVGGMTPQQIAGGQFPAVTKTLIDLISGDAGLVLRGGVASKDQNTANKLNVTACSVIMADANGNINRSDLSGASFTTSAANAVYYLDVGLNATSFSWGTSHPSGAYVTIATVTTDTNANIASVLDTRPLAALFFNGFDCFVGLPVRSQPPSQKPSAGALCVVNNQWYISTGAAWVPMAPPSNALAWFIR